VQDIDALALGLLAVDLGAGRKRAEDRVDPAVGIELGARVGDRVAKGEPLAWLHLHTRAAPKAWLATAQGAFTLGSRASRAASRLL
jgi:thymidine phosphorylase